MLDNTAYGYYYLEKQHHEPFSRTPHPEGGDIMQVHSSRPLSASLGSAVPALLNSAPQLKLSSALPALLNAALRLKLSLCPSSVARLSSSTETQLCPSSVAKRSTSAETQLCPSSLSQTPVFGPRSGVWVDILVRPPWNTVSGNKMPNDPLATP